MKERNSMIDGVIVPIFMLGIAVAIVVGICRSEECGIVSGIVGVIIAIGIVVYTIQEYPAFFKIFGCILGVAVFLFLCFVLVCYCYYCAIREAFPERLKEQRVMSMKETAGLLYRLPERIDLHGLWKEVLADGTAVQLSTDYIIFAPFFAEIVKQLERDRFFDEKDVYRLLAADVGTLYDGKSYAVIHHLTRSGKAFTLKSDDGDVLFYMVPSVLQETADLFKMEGAATAKEFGAVCADGIIPKRFTKYSRDFAAGCLSEFVKKREVETVKLTDRDELLYVSKNPLPNGKMTQIVIDLDK